MSRLGYWQVAPMPRGQMVLFSETLESRIPGDHPVRILDEVLERLDWTEWESQYHGKMGQPPIHPSVLTKVLLFGMMRSIKSSRQLEYALKHSIDFMWLTSGRTIDHTTLSEFRRKHPEQIKSIYKQLISTAIQLGLAKLSELCIDGTRVLADANRRKTWTQAKLQKVLDQLEQEYQAASERWDRSDDVDELFDDGQSSDQLPPELADLELRREQLDALMQQLQAMDQVRKSKGKDIDKTPAQIPKTDPDARILPNKEGGFAANYTPMVVTEMENGFIVATDVLIGGVEQTSLLPLVDQVAADYDAKVVTVMGDGAYPTGENLRGCEEREWELLSPIADESGSNVANRDDPSEPVAAEKIDKLPLSPQTKRFDKSAFLYDAEADCYYCPAGEKLGHETQEVKQRSGASVTIHHYRCDACVGCPLAAKCKGNPQSKQGRRVSRDEYEEERHRHRERMRQADVPDRYNQRSHFGETQFAAMKATMNGRRFLLRGLEKVQTEWLWTATAFNVKKLLKLMAPLRTNLAEESITAGN